MRHRCALFLTGCGLLLAACATLPAGQPQTLMREAALACADRVYDIEVINVTATGRLVMGYGPSGQTSREAFTACYQARVQAQIHTLVSSGHLALAQGESALTRVPLTMRGEALLVPVTLNHVQQVSMVVDPRATNTVLHPAMLERLGVTVPTMAPHWSVTLQGRDPLEIPLVRLSSLTIGTLTVDEIDVGIAQDFSMVPGADGLLGEDVLSQVRMTVDRRAQQLVLAVVPYTPVSAREYPVEWTPSRINSKSSR